MELLQTCEEYNTLVSYVNGDKFYECMHMPVL